MQIITRKEAKAQGLKRYYPGSMCKHGHVAERDTGSGSCLTCKRYNDRASDKRSYWRNRENHLARNRKWREENREYVRQKGREYYQDNSEKIKERVSKWYRENKDYVKEYDKHYTEENKERIKVRKREYHQANKHKTNARNQERKASEPLFNLKSRYRTLVCHVFKVRRIAKGTKSEAMLGCDWGFLKRHIEMQFTKGMSWEAFQRGEIHIDHIVPLATAKDEADVIALNHVTNLRPMWAAENMSKGDSLDFLL